MIVVQICRALAHAHGQGVLHRDVKPENVMITKEGVVKILYFGLAKSLDTTTLTNPGSLLGTIGYMSPEQLRGGEVNEESDVWSLGVILYEMFSGVRPFRGEYLQAVAYSILNEEHVPLRELRPDLPEGLVVIVERMLKKDPVARYADAEQVVAALDAFTGNGSGSGAHGLTRPRLSHRTRRKISRAVLGVAVIAVAVVAGAAGVLPRSCASFASVAAISATMAASSVAAVARVALAVVTRDEIDNANELIGLLSSGKVPLLELAPSSAEEDVFLIGRMLWSSCARKSASCWLINSTCTACTSGVRDEIG